MAKAKSKETKEETPLNIIQDAPDPPKASVVNEESALEAKASSGEKPVAVATAPIPVGHKREIKPVLPTDFGLITHKVRQYSCTAPAGTVVEDISNPEFWKHVAPQLQMGSEVRVLSEDYAWVAYGIVTFQHANSVKVTVTNHTIIDDVSYDTKAIPEKFVVKQRGVLKWCIVDTETGKNVFKDIPNQGKALLALDEYLAVLRR